MLKNLILLIAMCISCNCFALEIRTWDTPPKVGQLYGYADADMSQSIDGPTIYIRHYNYQEGPTNTWFVVTPDQLWEWFNGPNPVIYLPN